MTKEDPITYAEFAIGCRATLDSFEVRLGRTRMSEAFIRGELEWWFQYVKKHNPNAFEVGKR